MAFSINDLNYEKDSKERMPWEHYTEEFAKADPAISWDGLSHFLAGFSGNS